MNLLKKKKFQYGSYAVILTGIVVALVILFNTAVTALANHFGWYFDMTPEKLYALSDQSKSYLSGIDGGKNQVTIYFLTEEDRLNLGVTSANGYGQTGYWGMQPIHQLAKQLSEAFDFISVDYINANAEPERIRAIVGDAYDNYTFSGTTVLIDNYTEFADASGNVYDSRHVYRVYPRDTFFTYSYDNYTVSAFIGDYRFCTAIRTITMEDSDRPIVYFLSGHSEDVGPYDYYEKAEEENASTNYGNAASLAQLFRDSGYQTAHIDLRYEDFDAERDGVAVIFGPVSDYIATQTSNQFNEIGKLENYLSAANHSMMVFLDPKVMTLPNLEGFLEQNAAITFDPVKLTDDGHNSVSPYCLIGIPGSGDEPILSDLSALYPDGQRTVFNEACSISLKEGSGAEILYGVPDTSTGTPIGNGGDFAVSENSALLTRTRTPAGGNIFCCGATDLVNGEYLDRDAYANRELILRLMDEMNGSGRVSFGVPVKVIRDEGLDRTTHDVLIWTLALAVGLPVLIAGIGTVVFVRRRHS